MKRPSTVRCRMTATITETPIQTKSAFGIPKVCSAASVRMRSVAAVCGAKPPVWATISPRMTALTPSVKIIEGTRR